MKHVINQYIILATLLGGILLAYTEQSWARFLQDEYPLESETGVPEMPFRVPEGVTFDPFTNRFFATSAFGGKITTVSGFTGAESVFFQANESNQSFGGAAVNPFRRVLWVCSIDFISNPDVPVSQVLAIGLDSGKLLKAFDLPVPLFCNDIALDSRGNAYVTDSFGPSVLKISRSAITDPNGVAEIFATSPLLLPDFTQPIAFGQNGIAVTPTNSHLLVAVSVPAKIVRISLKDPTDVSLVSFTGDTFGQHPDPNGDPLRFLLPDGIQFVWGKLYVVYNGGIQRLSFTDFSYSTANVSSSVDVPIGLSTATRAYGRLYVIDSDVLPITQPALGLPIELPNKILRVNLRSFN